MKPAFTLYRHEHPPSNLLVCDPSLFPVFLGILLMHLSRSAMFLFPQRSPRAWHCRVFAQVVSSPYKHGVLKKIVLTPEEAGDGRCLDGTFPFFYFEPYNPWKRIYKTKWVIYLGDGRNCASDNDCAERATNEFTSVLRIAGNTLHPDEIPGTIPSSEITTSPTGQPARASPPFTNIPKKGVLSSDCNVNPVFCNFNKLFIPQCSSSLFLGNRMERLKGATADCTITPTAPSCYICGPLFPEFQALPFCSGKINTLTDGVSMPLFSYFFISSQFSRM
ncbi:hypothetical protein AAMO2058_001042300 [Amorphochlora amoebiformis]